MCWKGRRCRGIVDAKRQALGRDDHVNALVQRRSHLRPDDLEISARRDVLSCRNIGQPQQAHPGMDRGVIVGDLPAFIAGVVIENQNPFGIERVGPIRADRADGDGDEQVVADSTALAIHSHPGLGPALNQRRNKNHFSAAARFAI